DDNSYNVFGHYNTKNKRYNAYLSFVGNKDNAGENGGITKDSSLSDPLFTDRRTVPVNLGGINAFSIGFFASPIATKSDFTESSWLFDQRYDWGHGDTVKVNDTTFNYEFHPSFRIENTLKLSNQEAGYTDTIPSSASLYYFKNYGIDSLWKTRLTALSGWKTFSNDLSLIKFPSQKNEAHFIKAGATFEYLKGNFLQNSISFYNLKGHFEYHNLTKNEKWDLDAKGVLYLLGNNIGDYIATASLSRYLNEKFGDITLSFSNLNKTPAFIYQFFPTNYFLSTNNNLKKINITQLQFKANNTLLKYNLQVNYFIITNYTYFKNFSESAQYNSIFNLWQILLNKQFTAGHFNWYLDLALQQTLGNSPLHVPHLWTRNRFAYEGIFYKNMIYSAGIEAVYNTPYYQDNYSPVLQQFVYQDTVKIKNTLPNTAVFLDFRIKAFVAYVRAENLNTFVQPNMMEVAHYPYPGFTIRVGFQWSFVN
ncbi:MAG: putative porin, partial [Chitinophagaceae bacterium]